VALVQSDMECFFFVHVNGKKKIREIITILRARERINTFYITLNQRQHLTFGTVTRGRQILS
jgi:hypothetical protein